MDAIIYIRWSTLEQVKGDSYARQLNACSKFCADNGYNVIETVVDQGRSAYTGENIETGNLGKIVERIARREIKPGTPVIVEQLDRLTRLSPLDVIGWLTRVFPLGVCFITADRGVRIDREAMEQDQTAFMTLVFDTFRSHGESKRKSEMLLASWAGRRKDFAEGKACNITGVCPAWLEWNAAAKSFVAIENAANPHLDRPSIIRRIFDEADAGVGIAMIARKLNEDAVPPWGIGKRKSDGWHQSYIQKILRNPAVVGEFQPRSRRKGQIRGTNVGDVIPDYYPQIISLSQFERVSSKRNTRNLGGASKTRHNLFAGLVRCGQCGQRMSYLKKQSAGREVRNPKTGTVTVHKNPSIYFKCSGAVRGNRCDHQGGFNYQYLQDAVLDNLLTLALDDAHFVQQHVAIHIADQLAAAKRELDRLEDSANEALTMTLDKAFRHDERVKRRYADLSEQTDKQKALVEKLDVALVAAKGRVTPGEHLARVAFVRDAIDSQDDKERDGARSKVMEALQQIVGQITFQPNRTIEVSAVEGMVGFQFDDKGNLLKRFDLTGGLHEPALRNGMLKRDGIERSDLVELAEKVRERGRNTL